MAQLRKVTKRKTADELFRELIDEYYVTDELYKLLEKDREQLRKKLLKIIRYGHRGHGYHAGNQFAINSYWVRRKAFSQAKARELMGAKLYQRAFKTQKYVHLDAMEQQERLESTNQQLPKEPP